MQATVGLDSLAQTSRHGYAWAKSGLVCQQAIIACHLLPFVNNPRQLPCENACIKRLQWAAVAGFITHAQSLKSDPNSNNEQQIGLVHDIRLVNVMLLGASTDMQYLYTCTLIPAWRLAMSRERRQMVLRMTKGCCVSANACSGYDIHFQQRQGNRCYVYLDPPFGPCSWANGHPNGDLHPTVLHAMEL